MIKVDGINKTFVELSIEQLIEFITNDDLNARHEENLFDACIKWIDYDIEKRKPVCYLFFLYIEIKIHVRPFGYRLHLSARD